MRLRGQVGALSQEKAAIGSKRALNKLTADPETRKMMRDPQKAGMSALDTDLAKQLKRTPEFTGKFNDLLSDQVRDNIDLITLSLPDKKSRPEMDKLFSAQEL